MVQKMTAASDPRPYKQSMVDRLYDWLAALPVRLWVFYLLLGLALILVQMLFLWVEGGLVYGELLPVILFNGVATSLLLAMMQFFDHQAVTALKSMRPVLDTTGPEFDQLAYQLSNMPIYRPLAAGAITLGFTIIMEQVWVVPISYGALEQLPVFKVVYYLIDKSSAFLYGVFFYHTIRQLRLVNAINSNRTRVSLFNLGPLQGFSRLTATTAVGLVLGFYGWMLINPDLLSDPLSLGITVLITILAVIVFVWPLFGVHRRMVAEKEKMLHAIDLHFEAVFSKLDTGLQADDYAEIERLNMTIASLDIQHKRISAIPTWPWRPETAQFALTAIAIPLVLAVLQFLVKQAFGW